MTFYEEKLDQHLKSAACGCKQGWAHPGDLPRPATPLTKRPWVRIEHHARYRYLLQLDGHTCSWRFQYLLATNSPVLKQSSYFWEYYYGALTPGAPDKLWRPERTGTSRKGGIKNNNNNNNAGDAWSCLCVCV